MIPFQTGKDIIEIAPSRGGKERMKIKEITHERVVNLGNYESVRFGITVTAEEEEKSADLYEVARKTINKAVDKYKEELC